MAVICSQVLSVLCRSFVAFVLFLSIIAICNCSTISDLRLCGDDECESVIAYARALARHRHTDPIFLSFERGDVVKVTSKSAGNKPELWGGFVQKGGKKGYFPRSFVREYKVEIPNPEHLIKTEDHISIDEIMANKVKESVQGQLSQNKEKVKKEENSKGDGPKAPLTDEQPKDDASETSEDNAATERKSKKEAVPEGVPVGFMFEEDEPFLKHLKEIDGKLSEPVFGKKEVHVDYIAELNKKLNSEEKEDKDPKQPAADDVKDKQSQTEVDETEFDETDITEEEEEAPAAEPVARDTSQDQKQEDVQKSTKESETIPEDTKTHSKIESKESGNKEEKESQIEDETEILDETEIMDIDVDVDQEVSESKDATAEELDQLVESIMGSEFNDDNETQARDKGTESGDAQKDEALRFEKKPDATGEKQGDITDILLDIDETDIEEMEMAKEGKKEEDVRKTDEAKENKEGENSEDDLKLSEETSDMNENEMKKDSGENSEEVDSTKEIESKPREQEGDNAANLQSLEGKSTTESQEDLSSQVQPTSASQFASQEDTATAPPGYTMIDGTPFPLEMFEEETTHTPVVEIKTVDMSVYEAALSDDNISFIVLSNTETYDSSDSETDLQESLKPVETVAESTHTTATVLESTSATEEVHVQNSAVVESNMEGSSNVVNVDSSETTSTENTHTATIEDSMTESNTATEEMQNNAVVESSVEDKSTVAEIDSSESTLTDEPITPAISVHSNDLSDSQHPSELASEEIAHEDVTSSIEPSDSAENENMITENFPGLADESRSDLSDASELTETAPDFTQDLVHESLDQHASYSLSNEDSQSSEVTEQLPVSEGQQIESVAESTQSENKVEIISASEASEHILSTSLADSIVGDGSVVNKDNNTESMMEAKTEENLNPFDHTYATSADFISRKTLSHENGEQDQGTQGENKEESTNKEEEEHKPNPEDGSQTTNGGVPDNKKKVDDSQSSLPPISVEDQEKTVTDLPPVSDETTQSSSEQWETTPMTGVKDSTQPNNGIEDLPPPPTDKPVASVSPWQQEPSTGEDYEGMTPPGRHITDEDLEEQEDKAYQEEHSWSRTVDSALRTVVNKMPPSIQGLLEQEPLGLSPQMTIVVFIVTIVVATVIGCFGLCRSKKPTTKDPLLVIRGLEEKLFILTKENENMEDELKAANQKVTSIEKEKASQSSSSQELETELQNLKLHVEVLKKKMKSLETENSELKAQLSLKDKEFHSTDEIIVNYQQQCQLKDEMLVARDGEMQETNRLLEDVTAEASTLRNQVASLTDQVQHLETRKQQLLQEAEDWNEKVKDLTDRLDNTQTAQKQMQEDLTFKDNELEVLRDCFLQLKAFETDDMNETESETLKEKFKLMMDVSVVNASLKAVEDEKNTIVNKLEIETQCRHDMEEQIAGLQAKVDLMQTDKMKAERQCEEAKTKLNVLSHYFKEKELQLQRELGEQEALKKENINRLEHADEKSKMKEEELSSLRSQVNDLKAEILSAERDFRSQIAANEKKAHENWLAARAAERELKESKHESSTLRQKLTDLERRLMHGPSGLIRPLPTRGMPPPGVNGPLPGDRPGSRGGSLRSEDIRGSPGPDRIPGAGDARVPPHPGHRMPPPPHMDGRSPPPFDRRPPPDRRSPPYERGMRMPPPPHSRSPGYRMPPPDMVPRMRGPPPPLRGPNSPPLPGAHPDSRHGMGAPRYRFPPDMDPHSPPPRQQSQV